MKQTIINILVRLSFFINATFRRPYYTLMVRMVAQNVGKNLMVNRRSSVTPQTVLGDSVGFNGMTITGTGKVVIGSHFHSGPDCMIISSIHNYDFLKFSMTVI